MAEDAARLVGDRTLFLRAAAAACLRKNTSDAWWRSPRPVTEAVDDDGVEAARRAVFRSASRRSVSMRGSRRRSGRRRGSRGDFGCGAGRANGRGGARGDGRPEAFARSTAADRARRARRRGAAHHARRPRRRAPAPRAGSRAALDAALAEEDDGDVIARFLRVADTQLLWGRVAPATRPAGAPFRAMVRGTRRRRLLRPRRRRSSAARLRRLRRDGPAPADVPFLPAAGPEAHTDGLLGREAARRTDEVQARVKEIGGGGDDDDDEEALLADTPPRPSPSARRR